MPVATVNGIPATIRAGDTTIFQIDNPTYPNADWVYDFVIARRGVNVAKIRGAESGTGFLVTIGTDVSGAAAFTPGRATFYERFTAKVGGQIDTPTSGILTILPDPTGSIPISDNQAALTAAKTAMKTLMDGAEHSTVNFAGQSFTKTNPELLQHEIDRLEAIVNNELREIGADDRRGGYKAIRFRFR
jgi:hypothetical protein